MLKHIVVLSKHGSALPRSPPGIQTAFSGNIKHYCKHKSDVRLDISPNRLKITCFQKAIDLKRGVTDLTVLGLHGKYML